MCLYPQMIKNPKYKKTKKNRGVIPPITDPRIAYVPIGCGDCIECRKQKQREWMTRLLEDVRTNKNGKFITLTFDEEHLVKIHNEITEKIKPPYKPKTGYELENEIATYAVRMWLERWRKEYKKSLRHWLITELGHNGTERIHLHGIIWTDETVEKVEQKWQNGYIWPRKQNGWKGNYVSEITVNYITKYITKKDEKHKTYKPVILTSPGIGAGYTTRPDAKKNIYNDNTTNETYKTRSGHKIALPIYWRNKIYTETERERLWIQKLDKQERWICGEKIDISKGEEEYYRVLEHYRNVSKILGYGDGNRDWNRKKYEEERREIMQKNRIQKRESPPAAPPERGINTG